jgi:hypothetical protein
MLISHNTFSCHFRRFIFLNSILKRALSNVKIKLVKLFYGRRVFKVGLLKFHNGIRHFPVVVYLLNEHEKKKWQLTNCVGWAQIPFATDVNPTRRIVGTYLCIVD